MGLRTNLYPPTILLRDCIRVFVSRSHKVGLLACQLLVLSKNRGNLMRSAGNDGTAAELVLVAISLILSCKIHISTVAHGLAMTCIMLLFGIKV